MDVSVIIPTYNGAHKITGVLRALEKQHYSGFEVVVVVDGSTDNTVNLLEREKFSFASFHVVVQQNKGRAAVRNAGAEKATGELLVFFDDDMLPAPACLSAHIAHHRLLPRSILTGAQIDVDGTTDIQRYKKFLAEKWTRPLLIYKGKSLPREHIYMTAANFSISKALFAELGGFDEELSDAEDFDLAMRAYHKGIPLYYDHSAYAEHRDPITCASYIKRQRQYREAHQKLKELKPELYADYKPGSMLQPKGIKRIIWSIFAGKYWVRTVDHFNWLKIFPQRLRYRMYDVIIMAGSRD